MNLFGRTFGPEEIASLVAMLMVLVVWVGALRGQRRWSAGFKDWEARRKARREAEAAMDMQVRGDAPPPVDQPKRGPWG